MAKQLKKKGERPLIALKSPKVMARLQATGDGIPLSISTTIGALGGSTLGKNFDGQGLLFLFANPDDRIGILMPRACNRLNAPQVLGYCLGTGAFSGFFGIGGGFVGSFAGTALAARLRRYVSLCQ